MDAREMLNDWLEKAAGAPYPHAEASGNIHAHMRRMKQSPSKYPGGRKQAIAIGISQARSGKKEPMPKKKMGKGNGIPMYRSEETGIDDETNKAEPRQDLGDWLEKAKGKKRKKMKKDMDVATPAPRTGSSPDAGAVASSMRSAFGGR